MSNYRLHVEDYPFTAVNDILVIASLIGIPKEQIRLRAFDNHCWIDFGDVDVEQREWLDKVREDLEKA